MQTLRPALVEDLDDIFQLSTLATIGVTNLPQDEELLYEKLLLSQASFQNAASAEGQELYIFALEEEGQVIGTSSIKLHSGENSPYFRKTKERFTKSSYPHVREVELLQLQKETPAATELCALFLHPERRKGGAGRLLSLGRFSFMAEHLHLFSQTIFADLRGVIHENICPFWEAIGRKFCPIPFDELVNLYINYPKDFVNVLPKHKIYTSLLPQETQTTLGKPHKRSAPALKMLLDEGFQLTPLIHPMDGGPRVEALTQQIRSVQESSVVQVDAIQTVTEQEVAIVSKHPHFLAIISPLQTLNSGKVILPQEAANTLNLKPGDLCRKLMLK